MTNSRVVLTHAKSEIPTCNPNLMPFHINYTGPAAVSAFMRIEQLNASKNPDSITETRTSAPTATIPDDQSSEIPCPSSASATVTPSTEVTESESQTTLVVSRSNSWVTSPAITASSSTATLAVESNAASQAPIIEDVGCRFVSSFRGRTIHGLTIDLPEGYGGLVLQSKALARTNHDTQEETKPKSGKAKATTRGNKKTAVEEEESEQAGGSKRPRRGRLTRSAVPSKTPIEIVDDGDVIMQDAQVPIVVPDKTTSTPNKPEGQDDEHDDGSVKRLIPSAQFSAFTLWQPDRVVDKNRDEYYRSLTEWVSLANEIHRSESDS